jgi:hypothetical protein
MAGGSEGLEAAGRLMQLDSVTANTNANTILAHNTQGPYPSALG